MPTDKPLESIEWAVDNVAEYVNDEEGNSVLVKNKDEPSTSAKSSGFRARTRAARQYINYVLNALYKHVLFLEEGEVGDVLIKEQNVTLLDITDRYGNTWVDRGTDTIAGQTYRVFERTV